MTNEELIKEYLEDKCKYCNIKDCDGIHITIDHKTRCNKDELHSKWNIEDYKRRKIFGKRKRTNCKDKKCKMCEYEIICTERKLNQDNKWNKTL